MGSDAPGDPPAIRNTADATIVEKIMLTVLNANWIGFRDGELPKIDPTTPAAATRPAGIGPSRAIAVITNASEVEIEAVQNGGDVAYIMTATHSGEVAQVVFSL